MSNVYKLNEPVMHTERYDFSLVDNYEGLSLVIRGVGTKYVVFLDKNFLYEAYYSSSYPKSFLEELQFAAQKKLYGKIDSKIIDRIFEQLSAGKYSGSFYTTNDYLAWKPSGYQPKGSYYNEHLKNNQYQSQIDKLPGVKEKVKNPVSGEVMSIRDAIIDLNDNRNWTRDQIADWLETLDVDLEFKDQPNQDGPVKVKSAKVTQLNIAVPSIISNKETETKWEMPNVSVYSNKYDPTTFSGDVKHGSIWVKNSIDDKGYVVYIWQGKWVAVAEYNPLAELKTYKDLEEDDKK